MKHLSLDDFPCLLIVTDFESSKIEYCNEYALSLLGFHDKELINRDFSQIVSKGTLLFFESFIRPNVLASSESIEVQITLCNKSSTKIPSVTNVRLKSRKLYWAIFTAVNRDKLYQELIDTRDSLEKNAEELTLLTRIDPLTSLLNRRAATHDIGVLIKQIKRKYTPIAFLLIDIDYFKKINDTHGHDKGDEVLIALSETLKSSCRDTDILARWGGEEFLIVLYNSTIDDTYQYCKRLHQEIAKTPFAAFNLSISIGVSQLDETLISSKNISDLLIKKADIALFQAKENGRGRTEFSEC